MIEHKMNLLLILRSQILLIKRKNLGLHVIFSEELIDPRYASAVAQEIVNGKVLVLSPIEGLTKNEQASGIGYMDKMRENIKNLMEGLDCKQSSK
jgi:zinc transport system substrate-binding protein